MTKRHCASRQLQAGLRRPSSASVNMAGLHGSRISCALSWMAEKELSVNKGKFGQNKITLKPISGLSPDWLSAADDGSAEFEIALALAGIYDPAYKIGSLRANLEPVRSGLISKASPMPLGLRAGGKWFGTQMPSPKSDRGAGEAHHGRRK